MQNKLRKAFTLAEVLITLGVIAIVTTLVVPMVVNNYQKKVTATKVREAYRILSDAHDSIEDDCGYLFKCLNPNGGNVLNAGNNAAMIALFKNKLNIAKDCTDGTTTGCFANTTYLYLKGTNFVNPEATGSISSSVRFPNAKFILTNGMAIGFDLYSTNMWGCVADIYVDINNTQGPNQIGKDVFIFSYRSDANTLTPMTMASPTDCTTSGLGNSCSAKLLQENTITYY